MSGPTDPAEAHFDKGLWGFDGSEWQKLGLIWGYYDRWGEDLGATKSGDGTYNAITTAVPAGYVYVLQGISLVNISGARGMMRFYAEVGVPYYTVAVSVTPAQYVPLVFVGNGVLKAGDSVVVNQLSCLNGDVLYGGVWGYKMKLSM